MSACMSDVDLATLHKCRLDQRIKYQLSAGWVNRRGPVAAAVKTKPQIRSLYDQPTSSSEAGDKTNKNTTNLPAPVSEPCICCRCADDNDEDKCSADVDHVACGGGSECACQRSTTPTTITGNTVANNRNQVAGIKSDDDVVGDKRKVGNRRNCKHAVISCGNKKPLEETTTTDRDSYLTRRRSGTWP